MTTFVAESIPDRLPRGPGLVRTAMAMFKDSWLEFRDARILWLLLAAIVILFVTALSGRVEPLPVGRTFLDLTAKALGADLEGFDLATGSVADALARLDGSVAWIAAAEPQGDDVPGTSWKVTLARNVLPMVGVAEKTAAIEERFGKIPDGRLWTVTGIRETTNAVSRTIGGQTWEMTVAPGPDLKLLWPHRFTLFFGGLDLTPAQGAPLGLEVFILQKLLCTGLGSTILLLVCVVVTAAFVPTMLRKGTLELLLVRPIPRWQLIVFKYAAALLFVTALLGTLILATWVVTVLLSDVRSPGVVLALPSLVLFFALLLAVSVCTGVITRSAPAAMLVTVSYWAILFIVGVMHQQSVASRLREENVGKPRPTSVADALRGRKPSFDGPQQPGSAFHRSTAGRVADAFYAVLPHIEDLDTMVDRQLMRDFAIGGRIRMLVESPDFSWQSGVGLTLLHAAAYLTLACAIFARRDP
jgi:ABC-type transport system involved in multi-copper enzyme maturation permease subunit